MRITSYETLYESSIAYGIRKALMAEQRKMELDAKINELKSNRQELQNQVENLQKSIQIAQTKAEEKRANEDKAHREEVILLSQ